MTCLHVQSLPSSLVPRLSRNANMYGWESLVSFLHKHDVIEIELKQKGNILHVAQLTMRSTLGVYDIRPPITRYTQQVGRNLQSFSCSESQVRLHSIKVSLPPLYLWCFSCEEKKKTGSPHLHNFSVCVPEHGSLGTRLPSLINAGIKTSCI